MSEEIVSVLGDRRVTMADRQRMPYTAATLTEITRFANPLPTNMPHRAGSDITVGGHHIPAGAYLS